jgi:enoyl-CoA hydratase / 3-hydroxyacyl-CoA dehydrogenase
MFVSKVGVVGGGAAGAEIADVIAAAGVEVVRGEAEGPWEGFGDVELALVVAGEALERVLAALDDATPGHAILAVSDATASISELADATGRPDKVAGLHFLDPVASTRAVEVVEGLDSSPETVQALVSFAQAIRRTPIRCREAPGLVVERILGAAGAEDEDREGERFQLRALVEACHVLEEGVATARDVDLGLMAGAGLRPPPFARADATGLDELLARLERARSEWGEDYAPPPLVRRLVAQGRFGRASGQGFFPSPRPDAGWEKGPVKLETRGPVAIAWLDRPPANSIAPEVVEALRRAWERVERDAALRVLVIASASSSLFCAGADIKAFTAMDAAAGRALLDGMHGLLRAFERSSTVTIAAVNALALGGGCELAMACDVRIAAESASFGQPEIALGIIPGFGATQRLPRLVGEAKARELNLLGEPVPAEEAYAIGLVNRVVPDHELLDVALMWARKLAAQAPLAVEQVKHASAHADLDAGIEAEKQGFATFFASADGREGIAAFLEKRAPRFEGR